MKGEEVLRAADYFVIAAIALSAVLTGLFEFFTSFTVSESYIEFLGPFLFLIGLYYLYLISDRLDREASRHLKVVGAGGIFFASGWMHRILRRNLDLQTFLGLPFKFTTPFFTSLAIGGLVIAVYGLYLAHKDLENLDLGS